MAAEGCPAWQLEDVQRWLREQEGGPAWQLKEVQRIREAVALLWPPDVQALQDVQFYCGRSVVEPLQTEWKVSPKKDGTKKLVREVREELRSKVCEAAQRLQQQGPDEPAAAADSVPSRRSNAKRLRKTATAQEGERGDELQRPPAKAKAARNRNKAAEAAQKPHLNQQCRGKAAAQNLQHQGPDEPAAAAAAAAADPVPSRRSSAKRSRKRATEKDGEKGDELQRPLAKAKAAQNRNKAAEAAQKPNLNQQRRGKVAEAAAPRPRKRARETEAKRGDEQQRPPAKAKAARTRKQGCLTAESFAVSARDPSDSAAASSVLQDAPGCGSMLLEQSRRMFRMWQDLKKLKAEGWVVDDADTKLTEMISQASALAAKCPVTREVLRKKKIKDLYRPICGELMPTHLEEQDRTQVTLVACYALEEKLQQFLQAREDIQEQHQESYACLWDLKQRAHNAVVNMLPDMPGSPHQLVQALKESGLAAGVPFGRLPIGAYGKPRFLKHAFYFVRMLACVELQVRIADLPNLAQHAELVEKIVQHRSDAKEAGDTTAGTAVVPITAGDAKEVLQEFASDSFNACGNKRWLWHVLKVPKDKRQEDEYLQQVLDTAVDGLLEDIATNGVTLQAMSQRTFATIALYHLILTTWKTKTSGHILLAPMLRMLANAEGTSRKPYRPEDQCGEDVELAANLMPAYYRRLHGRDDLSLPVASPPVMCWICGEGFLHNGALFKHCCEHHGDYAEYRKRLFWRAQKDGFKPLLPWVKRHMLESATFHLTYSVPGSHSLKWSHPEAFRVAKERAEVACVVCARKDWLESRFTVYLWRTASGSSSYSELCHVDS